MRRRVRGGWCAALVLAACGCQRPAGSSAPADDGMVTVRVRVHGRGQVAVVDLARWCDTWCVFRVARGTPIRFRAVSREDMFERWRGPCGLGPDCFFAPLADVTLVADFEPDGPGLPLFRPVWRR